MKTPKHERAFNFLVGQVLKSVPTADVALVRHIVAQKLLAQMRAEAPGDVVVQETPAEPGD